VFVLLRWLWLLAPQLLLVSVKIAVAVPVALSIAIAAIVALFVVCSAEAARLLVSSVKRAERSKSKKIAGMKNDAQKSIAHRIVSFELNIFCSSEVQEVIC
jgi:hypothetical protein